MADQDFLIRLQRELIDKGKLVEAGWISLRIAAIPLDAGKAQLEEMRMAFFAGAQHLFASLLSSLDEGDDASADDLRRMDLIDQELKIFLAEFERKHGLAGRSQ